MLDAKNRIAKTVAGFLKPGEVVNLGIGLPTLVANYAPEGVIFHSENGLLGYGPTPEPGKEDEDFTGAGAQYLTLTKEASFFDSATSFAIIRGGHLDATILGVLEVDTEGDLGNWSIPGKMVGMGGAMDLAAGAKQVIAVTEHLNKNGASKVRLDCTLPLTGKGVVDKIVTELCVLDVKPEGLVVRAMAKGLTREELKAKTEAELIFPETIDELE
jgi:acetate CoA/acetoacetate CoA-transferase beta subunit